MKRFIPVGLFLAFAMALSPPCVEAQSRPQWDPSGLQMERAELEGLHERLQSIASSSAYSGRIRDRAGTDAGLIQERLERGDFRVGDRVILRVEGEPDLPQNVPVEPGPVISLPVYGTISLGGVLRSELEPHLTRELGRFINNPVVRAESLVRISIQGNVANPGFYTVPADMLVGEALMEAGGPSPSADLDRLRIERAGEQIWSGDELRDILAEGRTLDQLNLRAGDQLFLPERATSSIWGTVFRAGLGIASLVVFGTTVLF
jgi:protein involved in polysaccharide export with SLBB domain